MVFVGRYSIGRARDASLGQCAIERSPFICDPPAHGGTYEGDEDDAKRHCIFNKRGSILVSDQAAHYIPAWHIGTPHVRGDSVPHPEAAVNLPKVIDRRPEPAERAALSHHGLSWAVFMASNTCSPARFWAKLLNRIVWLSNCHVGNGAEEGPWASHWFSAFVIAIANVPCALTCSGGSAKHMLRITRHIVD